MDIEIRYCSMCGYEPQVLTLSTELMTRLKRKLHALKLIPDAGGAFEVTVDGELLYSKLETGDFPDEPALVAQIVGRAK